MDTDFFLTRHFQWNGNTTLDLTPALFPEGEGESFAVAMPRGDCIQLGRSPAKKNETAAADN
jgi:hypothetical protein